MTQGQVIAVVTDPKLLLQIQALDAQIAGLQSQLAQARIDLTRAQALAKAGAGSRETLEKAETAERVARSTLTAHGRACGHTTAIQRKQSAARIGPELGPVSAPDNHAQCEGQRMLRHFGGEARE